uniref:Integrase catalytic domain-containing protein n=1 Tax=Leptobrachium leishanense TaxID=445787 RepID=A0A8C5MQR9_9ANUR
MKAEVEGYCRSCLRCIQRKTLPARAAPMGHLQSQGPMDLVCIDFLCLEPDTSGQGNILVVTDHFTRYAQAFPTKDQRAHTVAKVLMEKFFVHYGLPKRIHSDQGRDFEGRLVGQLLHSLGIQKTRTTPYHPQGDALPERFNRTLLNMLGTLSVREKQSWSRQVATLVHAYNSTKNDSTGYSPYRLMFGREARLPVDLAFGVAPDGTSGSSHKGYVDRLRKNLASAFEHARQTSGSRELRNKKNYDLRVRLHDLQPGDRVLLKNLGVAARHKLADRWSSQIYLICKQLPGLPVYQIRPEGRAGPLKNWHRNHLLPLGEAVRIPIGEQALAPSLPGPCPAPRTRSQQARGADAGEDDSDEGSLCLEWIWPSSSLATEDSTSSLTISKTAEVPNWDETPPPTLPLGTLPPHHWPSQAWEVGTGEGDSGGGSGRQAQGLSQEPDGTRWVWGTRESNLRPEAPEFRLEDTRVEVDSPEEEDVRSEHDSMPSLEGSYEDEEEVTTCGDQPGEFHEVGREDTFESVESLLNGGSTEPGGSIEGVGTPPSVEGLSDRRSTEPRGSTRGEETLTPSEGLPDQELVMPKRSVRPPRRLTYDSSGRCTEEAVTTVTRVPKVSAMLVEAIELLERLEKVYVKLGYVKEGSVTSTHVRTHTHAAPPWRDPRILEGGECSADGLHLPACLAPGDAGSVQGKPQRRAQGAGSRRESRFFWREFLKINGQGGREPGREERSTQRRGEEENGEKRRTRTGDPATDTETAVRLHSPKIGRLQAGGTSTKHRVRTRAWEREPDHRLRSQRTDSEAGKADWGGWDPCRPSVWKGERPA